MVPLVDAYGHAQVNQGSDMSSLGMNGSGKRGSSDRAFSDVLAMLTGLKLSAGAVAAFRHVSVQSPADTMQACCMQALVSAWWAHKCQPSLHA